MILIAIFFGLLLLGAAGVQLSIARRFQRQFSQSETKTLPESDQKKAVVIISVRGCDPSLEACLTGVLKQDYADYEVHMIVDSQSDEAWNFVHDIKSKHDDRDILSIVEMKNPLETCSLKCHAIVQAIRGIDEQTSYIALLDADVAPHPQWLAELTGPLADPTVGGVTGNQWFEPESGSGIGSLIRSTWNAGALVPTIAFTNPWAGSFAMRTEDILDSGLEEIWSRSMVDDGPIKQAINDIGMRVEFAPSLIMVNRESCTLGYTNRWVTRMLTWSRLYEPTFYLSIIHALFSNGVMLANFAILLLGLLSGEISASLIAAIALVGSGWTCVQSYKLSRQCVAKSCQLRGQTLGPMSKRRFCEVFAMVAPTHLIYGLSCAEAILAREIEWREITYELKSRNEVKRLDYAPYAAKKSGANVSI